ncbi:hypothetical protein AAEX28_11985 [Lentisphaerota bacterium WC36G]|nr:hypothetical protein LJT99_14820 [Lentisphaerae bacterium WC36]
MKAFFFAVVVLFSIINNLIAGMVTKERGMDYYYSKDNDKMCRYCKGREEAKQKVYGVTKDNKLKEVKEKMGKCSACRGTGKRRRIIDFKTLMSKKTNRTYNICTVTKFEFPTITIKHQKGTVKFDIHEFKKDALKEIASWIQVDAQNDYYVVHRSQLPVVTGGLIGVSAPKLYVRVPLKGYSRITIKKDEEGRYYFFQRHCREYWGKNHKNNKFFLIKTNFLDFKNIAPKVRKQQFLYLRITKQLSKISKEEFKTMQWKKTNNGYYAAKKEEVDAEMLFAPDKETVKQILKGKIAVKNRKEKEINFQVTKKDDEE